MSIRDKIREKTQKAKTKAMEYGIERSDRFVRGLNSYSKIELYCRKNDSDDIAQLLDVIIKEGDIDSAECLFLKLQKIGIKRKYTRKLATNLESYLKITSPEFFKSKVLKRSPYQKKKGK